MKRRRKMKKQMLSLIVVFAMLLGIIPIHALAEGEEDQIVKLEVMQGEHGTIQADKTEVSVGKEIMVTATADEGYHLNDWILGGKSVGNPYTSMIIVMQVDTTVTAEFVPHSYGEWTSSTEVHRRWCTNEQCRHEQEEPHTFVDGACSKCPAEESIVKTYTVTYTDGVEGEVIFEDQVYTVEEGSTTPNFDTEEGSIERVGYIYTGWTPTPNESVTEDATYTAVWELCEEHYDNNNDTLCDACKTAGIEHEHSWGNWESNGDGTHTRICLKNADHVEEETCYGGTAYCKEKAKCSKCGTGYGEVNPELHKNIVNENADSETVEYDEFGYKIVAGYEIGYTPEVYCDDCKTVLSKSMTIIESYSEACKMCGLTLFYRPINDRQHIMKCVGNCIYISTVHSMHNERRYYYDSEIHSPICTCGYLFDIEEHDFDIIVVDVQTHKLRCKNGDCQYSYEEAHNFEPVSGTAHTFKCTDCGQNTEEHAFTEIRFERGKHWYVCAICKEIDTTSVTDHTLEVESKDYAGHANVCILCEYEGEREYHEYGYVPKEGVKYHDGICQVCEYKTTSSCDMQSNIDDTYHWSECSTCHRIENKEEHQDVNKRDGYCDICRLSLEHTHEYVWVNNGDGTHTASCYCSETIEKQQHVDNLLNMDKICDKCHAIMGMSLSGNNYNTQFTPDNPTDAIVNAGLVVNDYTPSASQAAAIVNGATDSGTSGVGTAHDVILAKDISVAAGSDVAGTVTLTAEGAARKYERENVQFLFAHIGKDGIEYGATRVEGEDIVGTIYVKNQSPFILIAVYNDTDEPDTPEVPEKPEKPECSWKPDFSWKPSFTWKPDFTWKPVLPQLPDCDDDADAPDNPDTPDIPDDDTSSDAPEKPIFSWFSAWKNVIGQISKKISSLFSWLW